MIKKKFRHKKLDEKNWQKKWGRNFWGKIFIKKFSFNYEITIEQPTYLGSNF